MRLQRSRHHLGWILIAAMVFGATVLPATSATAEDPTPVTVRSEKGVLQLKLDHPKRANGAFRFDAKNASGGYTAGSPQSFSANPDCSIKFSGASTLVSIQGVQSPGATPSVNVVGVSKGGIGVIDATGSTGVLCGRVDATQEVRLSLGSAFAASDAIDYAEIDIEGKQNVQVLAVLLRDGTEVGRETLTDSDFGGTDNGSDNGSNDNARFVIGQRNDLTSSNVLFDTIVLRSATDSGTFSLEGGADGTERGPLGTSLNTAASLFRVVAATQYDDGIDCGDAVDFSGGGSDVTLERTDEGPQSGCQEVPYSIVVRNNEVEFVKDEATVRAQGATFRLTITWGVAPGEYPNFGTTTFDIDFGGPIPAFTPEFCDRVGGVAQYPENPKNGQYWPNEPADKPWCVDEVVVNGDSVTETFLGAGDPVIRRS